MSRTLILALALAACNETKPVPDVRLDLPRVDVKPDTTAADRKAPDAAPVATPTKLAEGRYLLYGITSDDQIIALDQETSALVAVSVAGGPVKTIAPSWSNVWINGKVVFVWQKSSPSAQSGKALVWSAAGGTALPVATAALTITKGVAVSSADGAYIAYTDNAAADGSAADIYVAKADGTAAKKIARATATSVCGMGNAGTFAPSGQLKLHYCLAPATTTQDGGPVDAGPPPDGGAALQRHFVSVDPATGAVTTIFSLSTAPPASWIINKSYTRYLVQVQDASMTLWLYTPAGGAPVKVDSDVAYMMWLPDGESIVYRTMKSELKRADLSGTPVLKTLMTKGVAALPAYKTPGSQGTWTRAGLSPDGKWLHVRASTGSVAAADLSLASTETPGTPTQLASEKAAIFGDPFTADSQTMAYIMNVASTAGIGTLVVRPVAGGPPMEVANGVYWSLFGNGSRLVLMDHYADGDPVGRFDLRWVNLATSGAKPQLLATQVDEKIYFDSTKDKLIWAAQSESAQTGIFAAALP